MRILQIFILNLIFFASFKTIAGTYLANNIGCEKWKQKNTMLFSQQVELPKFISDSKAFFEQSRESNSTETLTELYKQSFNAYRKISSNSLYRPEYEFENQGELLISKKIIKPIYSKITSKNTGINSIVDTVKKLMQFNFILEYNKNSKEMRTVVQHVYDDGTKKNIPFEDYITLKLPKSCKHAFSIADNQYFEESELEKEKLVEAVRVPAKEEKSPSENTEGK